MKTNLPTTTGPDATTPALPSGVPWLIAALTGVAAVNQLLRMPDGWVLVAAWQALAFAVTSVSALVSVRIARSGLTGVKLTFVVTALCASSLVALGTSELIAVQPLTPADNTIPAGAYTAAALFAVAAAMLLAARGRPVTQGRALMLLALGAAGAGAMSALGTASAWMPASAVNAVATAIGLTLLALAIIMVNGLQVAPPEPAPQPAPQAAKTEPAPQTAAFSEPRLTSGRVVWERTLVPADEAWRRDLVGEVFSETDRPLLIRAGGWPESSERSASTCVHLAPEPGGFDVWARDSADDKVAAELRWWLKECRKRGSGYGLIVPRDHITALRLRGVVERDVPEGLVWSGGFVVVPIRRDASLAVDRFSWEEATAAVRTALAHEFDVANVTWDGAKNTILAMRAGSVHVLAWIARRDGTPYVEYLTAAVQLERYHKVVIDVHPSEVIGPDSPLRLDAILDQLGWPRADVV